MFKIRMREKNSMWLVVGLGNPCIKFAATRHNAGFMVIEQLAKNFGIVMNRKNFKAFVGETKASREKVILATPQTFMNLSGQAVKNLLAWFGIRPAKLIVIYDDLDLDIGRLRIRRSGSSGGHKGVASIIEFLGTDSFARVRIGIGRPLKPDVNQMEYVLGRFSDEELKVIQEVIERAASAVYMIIEQGLEAAMNKFN